MFFNASIKDGEATRLMKRYSWRPATLDEVWRSKRQANDTAYGCAEFGRRSLHADKEIGAGTCLEH
jgi:hypothetical protein